MSAIALYLRISQDDDNRDESNSIANQRDLLQSYIAADSTISNCDVMEFVDDGWSGTNFERPKVKELLDLARRGKIQTILVKDLSRWGRNYAEVGEHLDQIFPFLGIRFISVNDNYDSIDYKGQTAPMDVAFSSLMHDIYSKELSEKIKQSHYAKALKGEYICGTTFFGYERSETEKNKLVVDEEAAVTVRRIFDMACAGIPASKIAAALNADNVDTALTRRRRAGKSTLGLKLDNNGRSYWSGTQIIRILGDERYIGTMVCFKTRPVSSGANQDVKLPESEWIKVPNAHEAIITAEQFREANHRRRTNKKAARGISPNRSPLTGKIICAHCEHVMHIHELTQSR